MEATGTLRATAFRAWAAYLERTDPRDIADALHDRTRPCDDLWDAMQTVEEMGFAALRAALDSAGIPDTAASDAAWARPLNNGAEARLVVSYGGQTVYSHAVPTVFATGDAFKDTLASIAETIADKLGRPAPVATPGGVSAGPAAEDDKTTPDPRELALLRALETAVDAEFEVGERVLERMRGAAKADTDKVWLACQNDLDRARIERVSRMADLRRYRARGATAQPT